MRRGVKNILILLVPLLILVHFLVFFLFFGSLSFLVHFSGLPVQEVISAEQLPVVVQQAFGFLDLPEELSLPEAKGVWQKLNQTILRGRYRKMDELQRRALLLNTLFFGEGIYGLNAASLYYFQKPLAQLSAPEVVNLAGFFRVFSK